MVKYRILALAAITISTAISAAALPADSLNNGNDGENLLEFNVAARLDGQYVENRGKTNQSETGFMGKYIAIKAHGTIVDGLSYTWRQRFSRTPKDHTFWDQTDILDLTYKTGKFDVGAGKQVVKIGGYEYNRAPIDLMCPNLFVANVACYQFGVSGGYQITPDHHLGLQVSQSLFATAEDRNLYAFNLMWDGRFNFGDNVSLETLWSVNEMEYQKGNWCNYVALGNKVRLFDQFSIILDAMTRTYPKNRLFKNNTFMMELVWDINPAWRVSLKGSYDCNRGINLTSKSEITRGSQLAIGGGVVEYMPLRKKRHQLRLHAACFYSKGKNKNASDLMQKNTLYASLGVTWYMNLFNIRH